MAKSPTAKLRKLLQGLKKVSAEHRQVEAKFHADLGARAEKYGFESGRRLTRKEKRACYRELEVILEPHGESCKRVGQAKWAVINEFRAIGGKLLFIENIPDGVAFGAFIAPGDLVLDVEKVKGITAFDCLRKLPDDHEKKPSTRQLFDGVCARGIFPVELTLVGFFDTFFERVGEKWRKVGAFEI